MILVDFKPKGDWVSGVFSNEEREDSVEVRSVTIGGMNFPASMLSLFGGLENESEFLLANRDTGRRWESSLLPKEGLGKTPGAETGTGELPAIEAGRSEVGVLGRSGVVGVEGRGTICLGAGLGFRVSGCDDAFLMNEGLEVGEMLLVVEAEAEVAGDEKAEAGEVPLEMDGAADAAGRLVGVVVFLVGGLLEPAGFFTRSFVGEESTSKEVGAERANPESPELLFFVVDCEVLFWCDDIMVVVEQRKRGERGHRDCLGLRLNHLFDHNIGLASDHRSHIVIIMINMLRGFLFLSRLRGRGFHRSGFHRNLNRG